MNTEAYYKEQFEQLHPLNGYSGLAPARQEAMDRFARLGIPTAKHEEWKYTRIGSLLNKPFQLNNPGQSISATELESFLLPGNEDANQLVFVNGFFVKELSVIRSSEFVLLPLEDAAAGTYRDFVNTHFNHSAGYMKDGINALNTAFMQGGVFLYVRKGLGVEHPIYIYNITDSRTAHVLAAPRMLIHVGENAQVQFVETYGTLGQVESFTNQVSEIVVEKDALVEYYKIQNDHSRASQVTTTHFRQLGKSYVHTLTVSLDGGILRNNLNLVLEADYAEAHLYGLYFPAGKCHVDNHTIVDNVKPNCFSNELYKGILDGESTGVFNGKIFVRQDAQKTNAYQSNKNVLLSDKASVNTKPQLEIFADDVKCSHGCTVGQLDENALFYLRSRGVPEKAANALLVHAFATDILEHIKPKPIRHYVEALIAERLDPEKL